jgi:hypothetical protein
MDTLEHLARIAGQEAERDFAKVAEKARFEPVEVDWPDGRSVVVMDREEYARIADGTWRQALLVEELTDEDMRAIAAADVPPEHRYNLSEIKD